MTGTAAAVDRYLCMRETQLTNRQKPQRFQLYILEVTGRSVFLYYRRKRSAGVVTLMLDLEHHRRFTTAWSRP